MNRSDMRGFTLIELMIVVVIIGVLAAIAIPNFISLRQRASEAAVKSNMHVLQLSTEDFSVLNDGNYPTSAAATIPDGRTLAQLCPTGAYPYNPFNNLPSTVRFNADPSTGARGELALNPAVATNYIIKGNGANGDTLKMILFTGQ